MRRRLPPYAREAAAPLFLVYIGPASSPSRHSPRVPSKAHWRGAVDSGTICSAARPLLVTPRGTSWRHPEKPAGRRVGGSGAVGSWRSGGALVAH